jgi:hypothetical protein
MLLSFSFCASFAGILWIAYAFTTNGVIPTPLPVNSTWTLARGAACVFERRIPTNGKIESHHHVALYIKSMYITDQSLYTFQGVISLSVTLANIILIWIASMLMFRLKETLPIKKKVFWSDLKITRRIYQRRALLQVVEVDPNEGEDEAKDIHGPGLAVSRSQEDMDNYEEINDENEEDEDRSR